MIGTTTTAQNWSTKATRFLEDNRPCLPTKDYCLLTEILAECDNTSSIEKLCDAWKPLQTRSKLQPFHSLHILCFNVHGLSQRWGEVSLLAKAHEFDILVLGEVGAVDFGLLASSFANFVRFYQKDENGHGGVIAMVRSDIATTRISCPLPNVCVIDLHLKQTIRLVALYAPDRKTWHWQDLSAYVTKHSMLMGDFNVDLEQDGEKAEALLDWMDTCALGPVVPDAFTSLRADRTIDYALTSGVALPMQTEENGTTSDHKLLLGILTCEGMGKSEGSRSLVSVHPSALVHVRLLGRFMDEQ